MDESTEYLGGGHQVTRGLGLPLAKNHGVQLGPDSTGREVCIIATGELVGVLDGGKTARVLVPFPAETVHEICKSILEAQKIAQGLRDGDIKIGHDGG